MFCNVLRAAYPFEDYCFLELYRGRTVIGAMLRLGVAGWGTLLTLAMATATLLFFLGHLDVNDIAYVWSVPIAANTFAWVAFFKALSRMQTEAIVLRQHFDAPAQWLAANHRSCRLHRKKFGWDVGSLVTGTILVAANGLYVLIAFVRPDCTFCLPFEDFAGGQSDQVVQLGFGALVIALSQIWAEYLARSAERQLQILRIIAEKRPRTARLLD